MKMLRRAAQSAQEFIEPLASGIFRNSQAQQKGAGSATHRGNVTDGARQTFPADRIGWMIAPQKMQALQKPVARKNCFASTRGTKQSSIVSDAERNLPTVRSYGANARGFEPARDFG
jgi:hypothetical protein